jgi:predicted RNA-binding protein YlqC (UPF0109 family)
MDADAFTGIAPLEDVGVIINRSGVSDQTLKTLLVSCGMNETN